MKKEILIPFWGFVALWFATLVLPIVLSFFGPIPAVFLGILLPILWVTRMPMTCMGGAFIAFPMAMLQIGFGLMWVEKGIGLWMGWRG